MKIFVILVSMLTLLACGQKNTAEWTLDIVHTNDIHGHALSPSETVIGYATTKNQVEAMREDGKTVWLLDAGDIIQGSALTNMDKGASTLEVMNLMGYTAVAVGNHEFDFGGEHLLALNKQANFPWLSSNVTYNGQHPFTPYIIKEENGTRIAIVGLTTPETVWATHPDNVQGFTFASPIDTMNKLMPTLKKKADIIIVLAHLGQEGDYSSADLARAVSGIDLIIDGHDHIALPHGTKINNTLITSTGSYATHLGFIELTIKNNRVQNISAQLRDASAEELNAGYTLRPQAQQVATLVAEIQARGVEFLSTVVFNNPIFLPGHRDIMRASDTQLGRVIADAMRTESRADIALIYAGSIRTDLPAGAITYEVLLNMLPLPDLLATVNATGSQIQELIEWSVSRLPEANSGFFQVSGITFDVNPNAAPNARLSNIMVGNTPLDANTTYLVAVPDFIVSGGAGIASFNLSLLSQPIISRFDLISSVFMRYMQQNPNAVAGAEPKRMNFQS
jgi:5'-nucleotidase/UDP-sugar diphosphatase